MKKFLSLLIIGLGVTFTSVGQNEKKDPVAKKILDKTKVKFQSFKSFTADFTQKLESSRTKMSETTKGNIKMKGDKFRLKMGEQEVIVDGKKMWTVLSEDCETNLSSYDAEDNPVMKPEEIATLYEEGYKYIYMGDQVIDGVPCYSIDLEPDVSPQERDKQQVRKIRIYIAKKDNIIKRWVVYERNGNKYTYILNKFTPNVTLDDKIFVYNKKRDCPCCDLIDLRD